MTSSGCTNPNCKAKKRTTHTTANCYWPGGGKEGQFPPNFGQRTRANVATTIGDVSEHFVLSARVTSTLSNSGVLIHEHDSSPTVLVNRGFQGFTETEVPTFMDSGASDTMFVSKDAFTKYTATTPRTGGTAKAVDGGFEIVGEGSVTKTYLVDGRAKTITFTRALHTPTLNANLI